MRTHPFTLFTIAVALVPCALLLSACRGDEENDNNNPDPTRDAAADTRADRGRDTSPNDDDAGDGDSGDNADAPDADDASLQPDVANPCAPTCAPGGFCNPQDRTIYDGGILTAGCHPWPASCAPDAAAAVCECLMDAIGYWCGGAQVRRCIQNGSDVEISCINVPP